MSDKSLLPYVQTKVVWSDMELVTTRRLQICEHREQQIWEKQSGGLFRSDCATLGIPSSVPITGRYLLISTCYFYAIHNGFEPPTVRTGVAFYFSIR